MIWIGLAIVVVTLYLIRRSGVTDSTWKSEVGSDGNGH